jgi:hypothetical protein
MTDQSVFQQIEKAADFYEPALYELLTFYSALTLQSEELDGPFIPLTTVKKRNPSEVKIFAVGLLPPSSNVTGRLQDRSASVAGAGTPPPLDQAVGVNTNIASRIKQSTGPFPGRVPIQGTPGADRGPPIVYEYSEKQLATAIRDGYRSRYNRDPTSEELTLYVRQSQVETSGKWPNNNPGGIGNWNPPEEPRDGIHGTIPPGQQTYGVWGDGQGTKDGKSKVRYFAAYDTPTAGGRAFTGKIANGQAAAKAGDVDAYVAALGRSKGGSYYGPPDEILPTQEGGNGVITREAAYRRIFGSDASRAALAKRIGPVADLDSSTLPGAASAINGDATPSTGWKGNGSNNASEASKNLSQTSSKNLNLTGLGKQFLAAQAATIKALQAEIERIQNTPPLRLLVNPQSFKNGAEKIISENWGRNGPIVEHWGEQQDKLEGSGKIAAFYSIDTVGVGAKDNTGTGNSPGLGRTARQFSASYQNLLSLWLIYKNNGGIWLPADIESNLTKPKSLNLLGSVYIYYDDILYIGSFDSFNLNEEEGVPFSLTYDFSFTVRASFLLDRTDVSPLEVTGGAPYGAPQFFQGSSRLPPTTGSPTSPLASPTTQPSPNVPLPPGVAANQAALRGSSTGSRGGV